MRQEILTPLLKNFFSHGWISIVIGLKDMQLKHYSKPPNGVNYMRYILVSIFLLLSAGCATIFSGTKDNVSFNTKPEGATILVNGTPRGTTPATIQIARPGMGTNLVTLKKEGFMDMTFVMDKSFNGVSIINLTNLLGWGIDAMSGALMKNGTSSYDLEMEKKREQASKALKVEQVAFIEELSKDSDGQPIVPVSEKSGTVAVVNQKENVAVIFEK